MGTTKKFTLTGKNNSKPTGTQPNNNILLEMPIVVPSINKKNLKNPRIYGKLLTDKEKYMETALLIISILLIAIVLLQSNKASDASQIITGGNSELFSNQKERGAELLISRITFVLGMAFFVLSFVIYMI